MTKAELIEQMGKDAGISKAALAKGDRVEIRGFCSIFVKEYKGYTGRNPKTGQPLQIKAKKLPFFKSGLELKERVDYKETKTKKGGKHK